MADLLRLGSSYFRKTGSNCPCDSSDPDQKALQSYFFGFGKGSERTSDFATVLRWKDIADAIQEFTKMNHPEALRIQAALRLAEAAESSGWSSDPI